ncbi:hypothetical protein [Rhizobium tubonense]|uniref:Uncharacterized protein n=1 Tax=Rhizobium tubonense TaxID=484088 RepID=A0A2W4C7S8_9HYPH|nr:hypothetical protein [Rhizobium tubonense]PZM09579.1 hypothetical protein CPY51_25170 [Rhizobium tubonense]
MSENPTSPVDDTPKLSRLQAAFPLFMQKDFETPVNNVPYEVGVDNDYPAGLREMISAATVTYYLQNKSIDHVLRTYLKDMKYEEDPGGNVRLDRSFKRVCLRQIEQIGDAVRMYPPLLGRTPTVGEWIGDLTLVRISYSFDRAFAEADKGALFECVAIARMILEQIAWICVIRSFDDVEKIKRTPTTKCIGPTTSKFSSFGRLYGWMSDHVHWDYEAHIKVITKNGEFTGAWSATSQFKAIAYAMLIALASLVFEVFRYLLGLYTELLGNAALQEALTKAVDFVPVSMIRQIFDLSEESKDIQTILDISKVTANYG